MSENFHHRRCDWNPPVCRDNSVWSGTELPGPESSLPNIISNNVQALFRSSCCVTVFHINPVEADLFRLQAKWFHHFALSQFWLEVKLLIPLILHPCSYLSAGNAKTLIRTGVSSCRINRKTDRRPLWSQQTSGCFLVCPQFEFSLLWTNWTSHSWFSLYLLAKISRFIHWIYSIFGKIYTTLQIPERFACVDD